MPNGNGKQVNEDKARQLFDYLNTQTEAPSEDFEKFKTNLSDPNKVFRLHGFLQGQEDLGQLPATLTAGQFLDFNNSLFVTPGAQTQEVGAAGEPQPQVRQAGVRPGAAFQQALQRETEGIQEQASTTGVARPAGQEVASQQQEQELIFPGGETPLGGVAPAQPSSIPQLDVQQMLQQQAQSGQAQASSTAVAEPVRAEVVQAADSQRALEKEAKTAMVQRQELINQEIAKGIELQGLEGSDADAFAIGELAKFAPEIEVDEAAIRMMLRGEDAPGAVRSALGSFMQSAVAGVAGLSESIAIGAQKLDGLVGLDDKELADYATFQYGQWLRETAKDMFPTNPEFQEDFIINTLASGAGSVAGFIAGGFGGRLLKLSGRGTTAMLGAGSIAPDEYRAALEATGDPDKAFEVFLRNIAIGSAEALPLAKFFSRLDKWGGGGLKRVLSSGAAGGVEELTQETVSQVLTNLTAREMYDETRELVEGVKEGGAAGFILGFTMNALGVAVKQQLRRRDLDARSRAILESTVQYIKDEQAKLPQEDGEIVIEKQFEEQLTKENERISTIKKDLATKPLSAEGKRVLQEKLEDAEQARLARKDEVRAEIRGKQLHEDMQKNLQERKVAMEEAVKEKGISEDSKNAFQDELESIDKAIDKMPTEEKLVAEFKKEVTEEAVTEETFEEQPIAERTFRLESGLPEDIELPTQDAPIRVEQRGILFEYFTKPDTEGNPQYFKRRIEDITEEQAAAEGLEEAGVPPAEEAVPPAEPAVAAEEVIPTEEAAEPVIEGEAVEEAKPKEKKTIIEKVKGVAKAVKEAVTKKKEVTKKKVEAAPVVKKIEVQKKAGRRKPIIKVSNVDIERALAESKKEAPKIKTRTQAVSSAIGNIRGRVLKNIEEGTTQELGQAIDSESVANTAFNAIDDAVKAGFSISRGSELALDQVKRTTWYKQKIKSNVFTEQEFENAFEQQLTDDLAQEGILDEEIRTNEAARQEAEKIIDTTKSLMEDVKSEKIFNPQELKNRMDELVESIETAKKSEALSRTFLAGVSDKRIASAKKKIADAKSFEEMTEQLNEINQSIEDVADSQLKKSLLSSVKKALSEKTFIMRGGSKVGRFSPEVSKKLSSYKDAASFKNPEGLRAQKLKKISQWVSSNPDQMLPVELVEELAELNRTHLSLLSPDELTDILTEIDSLKTQGKTFNRLTAERTERTRTEIAEQLEDSITGGKGITKRTGEEITRADVTGEQKMKGAMNKVLKATLKDSAEMVDVKRVLTPEVMLDILDENSKGTQNEGKLHKFFLGRVNVAEATKITGIKNATEDVQDQLEGGDLINTLRKKEKITENLELTRDEMIGVFIKTHDPGNLASMIEGNFKLFGKDAPKIINKINDMLTPEEKSFAKWTLKFYEDAYPAINEVHKKTNFMDLPKLPGFSPMEKIKDELVESTGVNLTSNFADHAEASTFKPFTKDRTGSTAPVKLSALENLMNYISRTEHYKAYEISLRDMNDMLERLKPAIIQEHGKTHFDIQKKWLKDIAGDGRIDATWLGRQLLKVRKGLTSAFLGLNPVTAAKQAVSGLAFMTEVGEADYVKGVGSYFKNKKSWDELWDSVPEIANRSDTLTRDLREITKDRDAIDVLTRKKGFINKANFWMIRNMDKHTVRSGVTAAYLANGGKLGQPINEQAMEKAIGVVRRTQVTGATKDLPDILRGGETAKLLTMFSGQPARYFSLIYSALRAAGKRRLSKGKAARVMVYAWILPSILFDMISRPGGDDEERAIGMLLAPLRFIPLLGNIINAKLSGFEAEASPVFGLADEFGDAVKKVASETGDLKDLLETGDIDEFSKGEFLEGLLELGEISAQVKGVPTRPIVRSMKTMQGIINGEEKFSGDDAWLRFVYGDWALDKAEEEVEQIIEDEESVTEAEEEIVEAEREKLILEK